VVDSEASRKGESRPPTLEDLLRLCSRLNQAGAKYIVIGGMAVIYHGFVRATEDIDLLVDASPENQARIREALMELPDQAVREVIDTDLDNYQVVRVADEFVVDLMKTACGITYALASEGIEWAEIDAGQVQWQDRAHFFAISANLMRRILVDFARSSSSRKRGGNLHQMALEESAYVSPEPQTNLIELDDALQSLAEVDPRKARVVELRFFGGLSLEETAEVLKVSADTVWRDWDMAKSWLYREMRHAAR
jgi:RNA polymerase sigma factor (sigma-70 family)